MSTNSTSRLMGVDVASFGDCFADRRQSVRPQATTKVNGHNHHAKPSSQGLAAVQITFKASPTEPPPSAESPTIHQNHKADPPIKCLVYNDPFSSTYKKYIFTADGKYLLGGMMIGDTSDFVKLVAIVKKKARKIGSSFYGDFVD
jgi:nitrite reductase (NAD(P)H)